MPDAPPEMHSSIQCEDLYEPEQSPALECDSYALNLYSSMDQDILCNSTSSSTHDLLLHDQNKRLCDEENYMLNLNSAFGEIEFALA